MHATSSFWFARWWVRLLTVLAVGSANFFAHLGALDVTLMEARNFVAAREMAAGGSWLLPTMNGELRLAKPPLPTWVTAAVLRLWPGTTDPAVLRLPAAGMALLLVLFFWGLARELTRDAPAEAHSPGRTAWLAALVLGSSLLVVTVGREGQWDIFSNSLAVGSLWLLARGWNRPTRAYACFAGAGLLLGAAFLSKGPVSLYTLVLPFGAWYASRWQPGGRARLRQHWREGLVAAGVALIVGATWPAYVWLHVPAAALATASTEVASWGERHVQPPWYYFNFAVFSGVWTVAALAGLVWPYARRRASRFVPYAFLLAWLVTALVLLSVVPEKKERYMLPLLPPLVLLLTGLLRFWETQFATRPATRADHWLLRGWAAALMLACAALPVLLGAAQLPGFAPTTPVGALTALVFAGLAGLAGWAGWRLRATALITASTLSMSALLVLAWPAYTAVLARRTEPGLRRLPQVAASPALQHVPWLALDGLPIEQVWAAGHAVPLWSAPPHSLPPLPVVLVAASPLAQRVPAAWRGRTRLVSTDSFYLGRKKDEGLFFVGKLVRVAAGPSGQE